MMVKSSFSRISAALLLLLFVMVTSVQAQTVTNGNFESWTAGTPDGWTLNIVSSSLQFSQEVGGGVSGDAMKILALANPAGYDGTFANTVTGITPGKYYDLSLFVKSNDDLMKLRYFSIKWLDESNVQIGSDINENTYNANTANAWTEFLLLTNPIQAPAGAAKLVVGFRIYNGTGYSPNVTTMWVDNLTVTEHVFIDPGRTAGDVTQTPDVVGGTLNYVFTPLDYTCAITQDAGNEVPWVSTNGSFATVSGNWIGVAIDFPDGFTGASDIVSYKIDGVVQTAPHLSAEEIAAGELWFYFEMQLLPDATHTLIINWDGNDNYQTETFVINANGLVLQENPSIQEGIDNTEFSLTPPSQVITTTGTAVINQNMDIPLLGDDFPVDLYADVRFEFNPALPADAVISIMSGAVEIANYTATGGETSLWLLEQMSSTLDRVPITSIDNNEYNYEISISNLSVETTYHVTSSLIVDYQAGFTVPTDWFVFGTDLADIIVSNTPVFTLPFYEGFENDFTYLDNAEDNTVDFTVVTNIVFAGNKAAFVDYSSSNTSILQMLGPLNLTAAVNPVLKFAQIAETEGNYDHCYIEVSTDGGSTWTILPTSAYLGSGIYALPSYNTPEGPCFTEDSYTAWDTPSVVDNTWWRKEKFSLATYAGQANVMVRFRLKPDTSVERQGWFIDAVEIYDELCTEPMAFTVQTIWSDGATLGWTSNESGWNIEVGPVAFNPGTGAEAFSFEGIDTNPYTITGLLPAHTYYAYIQSDCGTDGNSVWTGPVVFTTLVACPAPTGVTVSNITTSGATLTWTQPGTPDTWDIIYGPSGFIPALEGTLISNTTEKPYAITGLTGNTTYQVYVRADCGTSNSEWAPVISFTTLCDPTPITIVQGFNTTGTNVFPQCWSQQTVTGTSNITFVTSGTYPTVAAPYEGSRMVYWNSDVITNGNKTRLVSLPVSTVGQPSVDVEFYWYFGTDGGATSYLTEGVQLQYSTDGVTWINAGQFLRRYNATAGWSQRTITLPGITANQPQLFVGFLFTSNAGYNCYLDKVTIKPGPACLPPDSFTLSALNPTSATVVWTESYTDPAVGYDIYFGTSATAPTSETAPTYSVASDVLTYSFSSLTQNTAYYAWIRSNCGSGSYSTWSPVLSFTTPCDPISVFPWTENFDGVTTPALPGCWNQIDGNNDGDFWKTFTSYGVGSSIAACIYTDYNAGANNDYLVLPLFNLNGNQRLKYYVRSYSTSEPNDYRVVLSTTGNAPENFTTVLKPLTTVNSATMTEISPIDLSAYSGNVYIAIHVPQGGLDGWYLCFDNFTVEDIPSCAEPTLLAASNIAGSSATLSWTASLTDPANGYEIYYSTVNTAPNESTVANTSVAAGVTTCNLTGLNGLTTYYAWVRAYCATDDYSFWTGPVTFTTLCAPVTTYPHIEPFTTYLPNTCWTEGDAGNLTAGPSTMSATASSWINDGFLNSGTTGAPRITLDATGDNDWIISPQFEIPDSPELRLKYNVGATQAGATTAPTTAWEADDYVQVLINAGAYNNWQELFIYNSSNVPSNLGQLAIHDLSAYAGQTVRFAFRGVEGTTNGSASIDFFFDNFTVEITPTCETPSNLAVGTISQTTADISWTASTSNPAGGYDIYYSTSSIAPDATTVPSASVAAGVTAYEITSLNASAIYYVWIRSVCGAGDNSIWIGPVSFTTLCAPITTFPYLQSFGATIPACWSVSEGSTGASYHWAPTTADATHGAAAPQSGSHFMYLYVYLSSSTYNPYYLTTEQFELGNEPKMLSYYYYLGASGYTSTPVPLTVQISADDGATWTDLYVHNNSNSTFSTSSSGWNLNTISLSGYMNETVKFRFKSNSNYGSGFCDQGIDEFSIYDLPSCIYPTALSSTGILSNSATVNWIASESTPSAGYDVYYSTSTTPPEETTTPNENVAAGVTTINLTGLTASTTYYVWVRSDCGGGDYSSWAGPVSFTTACEPVNTYPYLQSFGAAMPNCWAASEGTAGASYHWAPTTADATHGAAAPQSGTHFMYLYVYLASTTYNPYYLRTESFDLGSEPKLLSYYYYLGTGGYTTSPVPLTLQISTNGGTTWTDLFAHTTSNSTFQSTSSGWVQNTVDLTEYAGAIATFRFMSNSNYGNSYCDQAIDEFSIYVAPTCMPPTDLNVSGITSTEVDLNWTESTSGASGGYDIFYTSTTDIPDEATVPSVSVAAGVTLQTLTGLTEMTDYNVWVRANCGGGDFSTWAGPLSFETQPTCPEPSGIAATNITTTSAQISWAENGDATVWDMVYGLTGFDPETEGITVSGLLSTDYLIDGTLNPSTIYQVYVRADCGGGDYSEWVGPYSFTTLCGTIAAFPWTENFDAMPTIGSSVIPSCWKIETTTGTPWASATASTNTYNDPFSAPNYMTCYYSPSSANKYLITPGFVLTAGVSYDFSFKFVGDNYTGWTGDVRYNTSQTGTGSTVLGTAFLSSTTTSSTTYTEVSRNFVPATSGTYYFMVRVYNTATPYYLGFDNFKFDATPTCVEVSSVAVSQVTNHTAQVTWQENGDATSWNILYGPTGFDVQTEGTLVEGITSTSYLLTGLDPVTAYQVYVQADCGAGDLSYWSSPASFTTLVACPAVADLTLEDATYESLTLLIEPSGTETSWDVVYGLHGFVVGEGTYITVNENPFTITGLSAETQYDFYIRANCGTDGTSTYSTVHIFSTTEMCPEVWDVAATDITFEGFTLGWDNSSTEDTWNIEVGLPGFDPGTGNAVITLNGITANPYVIATGLEPETAYDVYVMADCDILGISDWYGPLAVTTNATCLAPVDVIISDVTNNTAEVTWTEAGTATLWNLVYGPTGFNPQTQGTLIEGLSSTSYIIENLDANTDYDVYVQADCGSDDVSDWSTVSPFSTECDIIDEFAWTEEFTDWAAITSCWDLTGGTQTVTQYNGGAVEGSFWSWYNEEDAYLTSPLIDKSSLTNPYMEFFWSHLYSTSYPDDRLDVEVSDDNGETWILVWTRFGPLFTSPGAGNTAPGTYITSTNIDLSSFDDVIQFRFHFISGYGPDVFIDKVSIFDIICEEPTDLAVSDVDYTSAEVSWTDVSGEGVADLIYGASGFDPLTEGTLVEEAENPYIIESLTPNTTYDVYVRSVCAVVGETEWIGPVTFTTLVHTGADILSYSFGSEIDHDPATIDANAKTVLVYVVEGTDLTNLVAEFTLSDFANATVNGVQQVSATTPNDFSGGSLTYVVTAEDGNTVNNWVVTVEIWVGNSVNNMSDIYVLPNPNNGKFVIHMDQKPEEFSYELIDVTGRVLLSRAVEGKGVMDEMVDVKLAPGSYQLKFKSGKDVRIEKLIIE
ncbi:MAG: fibronectin type III domain-containing protein [Bacteroidales bacterium]|nr:fibronectin type III domain-containing protein [Bacteroidales bacterium]